MLKKYLKFFDGNLKNYTAIEVVGLEKASVQNTWKFVWPHCAANDIKTCHWVNIDMKIAEIAANNNGDPEEGRYGCAHSSFKSEQNSPRLDRKFSVSQGFSLSRPKKSM